MPELSTFSPNATEIKSSILVFVYGFEDRALNLPEKIFAAETPEFVVGIRYAAAKGKNREVEARALIGSKVAASNFHEICYDTAKAAQFESALQKTFEKIDRPNNLVLLDISAASKFLILVCVVVLVKARFRVKIVYSEALEYSPSKAQFDAVYQPKQRIIRAFAGQTNSGMGSILRSACLSSTRMQGQPTCVVAFTSFNEELIRHAIGTINPHRLILINGMPPREEYDWRARATQEIHRNLLEEYPDDNSEDPSTRLLVRTVSTLDYRDSLRTLLKIHAQFSLHERMIFFATGSKMQAVALALLRLRFADVHIEYPTPDSYFFDEYSRGAGACHELDLSLFMGTSPEPEIDFSAAPEIYSAIHS
jgi:hypothetical protein